MSDQVEFYGFTPVPRDPDVLFRDHPTANAPATVLQTVEDYPFPESPLVREVETFVTVGPMENTDAMLALIDVSRGSWTNSPSIILRGFTSTVRALIRTMDVHH